MWLTSADGIRLYAATAGDGSQAVVLVHESPADLCGWLPTMQRLAAAGVRTVALDLRGFGLSGRPPAKTYFHLTPDVQAAVDEAHSLGAEDVILMGGSLGGATVLSDAWRVTGIAGVVSLSGELGLSVWHLDSIAGVRRLHLPLLVLASREDHYLDAADAHRLLAAAASSDKQLALYPAAFHGWDLLDDAPYRARVQRLLLAWLRAH